MILISGPVQLRPPAGVTIVPCALQNRCGEAVMRPSSRATSLSRVQPSRIITSATVSPQKLKKTAARFSFELDPTPDILAEVGEKKGDRLLIGFAAETEHLVEEARRKLKTKKCDMIVANLVGREDTGFEADDNEVTLITRSANPVHIGPAPKREIADGILDQIPALRLATHSAV